MGGLTLNLFSRTFKQVTLGVGAGAFALLLTACDPVWNSPYVGESDQQQVLYTAFTARPKHLDPAQSYTSDEAEFTYQMYEAPFQYHYLKRPYTLIPQSAARMPTPVYFDANGKQLPDNAADNAVAFSQYTIEIKPGILYAPHPAFAKDAQGAPAYLNLSEQASENFFKPSDFPLSGTRELLAEDFVYEIKRLAHPRIVSPIFGHMAEYIEGLKELGEQLKRDDALLKKQRKAQGLSTASADLPWLDLRKVPLSGVKVLDAHRFQVRLKGKYPQFVYWMAMPFFAPIAWEAHMGGYMTGLLLFPLFDQRRRWLR